MNHNQLIIYGNILVCSLLIPLSSESPVTADQCEVCCTRLFGSSNGIINVKNSSSILHTISYILRCLMSTEEVVIISDVSSTHPIRLHNIADSEKEVCSSHPENVPVSRISVTDFLQDNNHSYFQKIVPTFDPGHTSSTLVAAMAKRTNFIFVPDSSQQMVSLITKVDRELQRLQIGSKFFWQPYIIFLWPKIEQPFKNLNCSGKSCSNVAGKTLLNSWFENYQPRFTIDTGVFFLFIVQKGSSARSRTNLHLSIWECFKLKGKFILKEITRFTDYGFRKSSERENKCSRNSSSMMLAIEKANSYIFLERFLRRDNFHMLPVTASILMSTDTDEWISIRRNESGKISLESGSSVDIYKDMQILMNFSEEVSLEDGVQYLPFLNISSATLPLNSIHADILINQKSVTPGRAQIYAFLQPTYTGIYEAFFRQPSVNAIRNIVSAPFTISLWTVTMSTWALIMGCLYCWGYLAKRRYFYSDDIDTDFIQEIGLWVVAAMSQKSWYLSPSSTNFKTIFLIGSVMSLVCYAAYSAVIVSFLTVKIVPVKTVDDLIHYKFKFTVHESSEATLSLLQELITTWKLNQGLIKITTEQEITHLNQRTKALLSYPDLFYKTADQQNYTENFVCTQIYSLPVGNTPYKSAMAVGKGSQFRETFSAKLLIIIERGLNYRYKKAYDDNKAINCQKQNHNQGQGRTIVDPVHFNDAFTSFLVIYVGWLVAVFTFFSERLLKRRRAIKYNLTFLIQ